MKKSGLLFCVFVLAVVCISSCTSTNPFFGNQYDFYAYSSCGWEVFPSKDDLLFIFVDSDFKAGRLFEEELKNSFAKEGVNSIIFTDFKEYSFIESNDEVFEVAAKMGATAYLMIDFAKLYTYEHGGGVATLECDAVGFHSGDLASALRIYAVADGTDNDFESFNASLKRSLKGLSKAIVEQFMRFVVEPTEAGL